jgi:hypothetical protein
MLKAMQARILTNGIKHRSVHQRGLPAISHRRMMPYMGIMAPHPGLSALVKTSEIHVISKTMAVAEINQMRISIAGPPKGGMGEWDAP